jgi:transposase
VSGSAVGEAISVVGFDDAAGVGEHGEPLIERGGADATAGRIPELHALAQDASRTELPDAVRGCVELIIAQIDDLQSRVKVIEKAILACHRASEVSLRLQTIPGIGVITATAIAATVAAANSARSRARTLRRASVAATITIGLAAFLEF